MKRDLDMVDDTFELFEGGGDFAESFSLFDDTKTEPTATTETTEKTTTKEKKKIDSEKLTQALTSVGGAVASGVTLYKAYENPQVAQMRASKKQQQLELREVCGRKPLLKKRHWWCIPASPNVVDLPKMSQVCAWDSKPTSSFMKPCKVQQKTKHTMTFVNHHTTKHL